MLISILANLCQLNRSHGANESFTREGNEWKRKYSYNIHTNLTCVISRLIHNDRIWNQYSAWGEEMTSCIFGQWTTVKLWAGSNRASVVVAKENVSPIFVWYSPTNVIRRRAMVQRAAADVGSDDKQNHKLYRRRHETHERSHNCNNHNHSHNSLNSNNSNNQNLNGKKQVCIWLRLCERKLILKALYFNYWRTF